MMLRFLVVPAVALVMAVVLSPVPGVAMGPSNDTASSPAKDYDNAVKAVKRNDYRKAIKLLKHVLGDERRNADALNYMGYSQRKLGKFNQALSYYKRALAVDPDHRGANEYIGEAYLELNDLPRAEERLARLIDICGRSCPETRELSQAIQAFRSGRKPSQSSRARRW